MLKYAILLQIHNHGDVNVSETSRKFRASKSTIYRVIDSVKSEIL